MLSKVMPPKPSSNGWFILEENGSEAEDRARHLESEEQGKQLAAASERRRRQLLLELEERGKQLAANLRSKEKQHAVKFDER